MLTIINQILSILCIDVKEKRVRVNDGPHRGRAGPSAGPVERETLPAADGRHEVDLGVLADPFHQAHSRHLTIHRNRQV